MIQKEKLISSHLHSGVLYESGFCEIKDWVYDLPGAGMTRGFNDCLCILYVHHGEFLFDISRQSYSMHSGYVVIDKPGYEYGLRPAAGACTIFNFTKTFYERYLDDFRLRGLFLFANANFCSIVMRATAEVEYLHFHIRRKLPRADRLGPRADRVGLRADRLEIDQLVLDLFEHVIGIATEGDSLEEGDPGGGGWLGAMERAKEYLNGHFQEDISLQDLSVHCCMSPYHLIRVFKRITAYTPHQYLLQLRLKHGEIMLKNGQAPITEVAYDCGFTSVEYFATAFRNKYRLAPSHYRKIHRG